MITRAELAPKIISCLEMKAHSVIGSSQNTQLYFIFIVLVTVYHIASESDASLLKTLIVRYANFV
jgi:hypothetical protein